MSGQSEKYNGYVETDFIRMRAGFQGDYRVSDAEINASIKAAEEQINDETNLKWLPYDVDLENTPPYLIREITKFLAIAFIRNLYPDVEDTYKKNYDMAMLLLERFKSTNIKATAAGPGGSYLSPYNADTNDPDLNQTDMTQTVFSRDYIPTFNN